MSKALAAITFLAITLMGCGLVGVTPEAQAPSLATPTFDLEPATQPGPKEGQGSAVLPSQPPTPTATPAPTATPLPPHDPGAYQDAEVTTEQRINVFRANRGLQTLARNEAIAAVARAQSEDMAKRDFFAHVNPDGQTPQDRVDQAGLTDFACGENLAEFLNHDRDDAEFIAAQSFTGWLNSPGHFENMITPRYDTGGVGVYVVRKSSLLSTRYDIYVTHLLCNDLTEYNRLRSQYQTEQVVLEQLRTEFEGLQGEYQAIEEKYVNNQATRQELDAIYEKQEQARLRFNEQVAVVNDIVERMNAAGE